MLAKPLVVFIAFAGGAATSAGAGIPVSALALGLALAAALALAAVLVFDDFFALQATGVETSIATSGTQ
jgi:hypothetical protein